MRSFSDKVRPSACQRGVRLLLLLNGRSFSMVIVGRFRQAFHIPELDRVIAAAGGQLAAVWTESQTAHDPKMPAQSVKWFKRFRVPQSNGCIFPCAGNPSPGAVQGHRPDISGMARKSLEVLACARIPNLHRVPFASRHQAPAIGAEGQAIPKAKEVRLEGGEDWRTRPLQVRRIPSPHLHRAFVASRGHVVSIRTENNGPNLPIMAAEHPCLLMGPGIEHLDCEAWPVLEDVASFR